jgi:hypothetical protein
MQNLFKKQKFSILETLIISVCVCAMLFAIIFGIFNQNRINQDKIRIRNLVSLSKALSQYYNDSSSFEFSRKFPISQCSTSEPNSVDYEHTLYLTLTGIDKNAFKYLEPNTFPQDNSATYSDQIDSVCSNLLKGLDTSKYSINNKRCDYTPEKAKNFCYLYSTSPEGDRYTLSMYSDFMNKRASITKLRNNQLVYEGIDPLNELII